MLHDLLHGSLRVNSIAQLVLCQVIAAHSFTCEVLVTFSMISIDYVLS
jgi:hypothetical protein